METNTTENNDRGKFRTIKRQISSLLPTIPEMGEDPAKQQSLLPDSFTNLEELARDNGMHVLRENGQQIYGPPINWEGPPPPVGSEVFVGRLPRKVDVSKLIGTVGKIGPIYKIRLMMNFSGTNRGYCFVQYTSAESAERAIKELNRLEIAKGVYLGVRRSVDNRRLLLLNIPIDKTAVEIMAEIGGKSEGVANVIAYPATGTHLRNCGFAFVDYDSHRSAAVARRKFIYEHMTLWKQTVDLDWAEPTPPTVRSLFLRNFKPQTPVKKLKKEFNRVSGGGVLRVRKFSGFAFIDFATAEQADHARVALDNTKLDGAIICISWARYTPEHEIPQTSGTRKNRRVRENQQPEENSFVPNMGPNPAYGPIMTPPYEQSPGGFPPFQPFQFPMTPPTNLSPQFCPQPPYCYIHY